MTTQDVILTHGNELNRQAYTYCHYGNHQHLADLTSGGMTVYSFEVLSTGVLNARQLRGEIALPLLSRLYLTVCLAIKGLDCGFDIPPSANIIFVV